SALGLPPFSSTIDFQTARTSPPAQNALPPSPRISTAFTAGSVSQAASCGSNAWIISRVSAFSALGRLSDTMPMPPSVAKEMSCCSSLTWVMFFPDCSRLLIAAQKLAGNDDPHDFVGAFEDLVHAQIAQDAFDRIVPDIAVAAMYLQRFVAGGEAGIGSEALGHRRVQRGVGGVAVQRKSRAMHHQARGVQFRRHVSQLELQCLKLAQLAAELGAHLHVVARRQHRRPGTAQRAGSDI